MLEVIKKLAAKYAEEFIGVRRHIHANPELSYQEYNTSAFIQEKLTAMNIPFEVKAVTGVISDGFAITQFPAANAGAIFHVNKYNGRFHGEIQATIPNG